MKPTSPASTRPLHLSPTLSPSLPSVFAHSAQSLSDNLILARTMPTSCLSSSSVHGPKFRLVEDRRLEAGPRIRVLFGVTKGSSRSSSSDSGWNVDDSILGAGGHIVGVPKGSGVVKGCRCRGVESFTSTAGDEALRFLLLFRVTIVYVYVFPDAEARGVSTSISSPPDDSSGVVHDELCDISCFEGVLGLGVRLGVGVARRE
ncbi:hypothetical protein AA313_de0208012 [Arthrobotrys entomopaga]|nr:hypothetical protein AA313_de0208012 [Arthrobotrys entomopaga]